LHASKLLPAGDTRFKVLLIGAGGTGSIMLNHLCRIDHAFQKLGGVPMSIEIIDDDLVSEANLGRQAFCAADIGMHKSVVLAQRARVFTGCQVSALVKQHEGRRDYGAEMVVSCTDSLKWRQTYARNFRRHRRSYGSDYYWLDLGNSADTGQIVLGGHGLPCITDVLPELKRKREPKVQQPSCSMAESLARQDLFINSTVANLGAHLIWRLLRHGGLNHHGYFANLNAGIVRPIPCPQ
jgi:sulfur-carrier protein adenylyltransferase/sulfurtransferase